MGEEAVPVILVAHGVVGPVRLLGVDEDDARVLVAAVGGAPHVVVAVGAGRLHPGGLEPRMLVGRVIHDQIGDDAQAAGVGRVEKSLEVLDGAVGGMDAVEIGDVVAVVAQGRRVHGQDPQAVDAEVPYVVQALGQPGEVSDAVPVGVAERLDVDLVEDGVLVPVVGHRPSRQSLHRRSPCRWRGSILRCTR